MHLMCRSVETKGLFAHLIHFILCGIFPLIAVREMVELEKLAHVECIHTETLRQMTAKIIPSFFNGIKSR